jgi:ABC-2 type transport system permease protein
MTKRLWAIIKKEFTQLIRDPITMLMMIALPVLLLIIYGYAASFDVKNIPLAVFDQDKSPVSREFISRFRHSGYFDLVEDLNSNTQFKSRLDSGKVKVIINIPAAFSDLIIAGEKAQVQVLVDGSDPTWASSALSYINEISQDYYHRLVQSNFERQGIKREFKPPINLIPRIWYNETLSSVNFFIPGLIAVILMQISATLTSLTIISEKEQGTMESLVVSPVRKNELILGKVLPYVIIAFLDVIIVTIAGLLLFNIPVKGNYLLLLLSSFVFLMGAMGIGLLISTNARSSQEAIQVAILITMLPSLLLSGFVFPIENMPWILQGVSLFIPARYFIEILRAIYLKGVGIQCFWQAFIMMAILSILVLLESVRRFKKRLS